MIAGRTIVLRGLAASLICSALLTACSAVPVVDQEATVEERVQNNLRLVVTDLVTALIQVRELNPATTTLQISSPSNELGVELYKALDVAGYGLQTVDEDQGDNYVSYAVRTAETEAGIVNDYVIRVRDIELRREYNTTEAGIFPSSLLYTKGVRNESDIVLNEQIFAEQGGGELFLSGIDPGREGITDLSGIKEVYTDESLRVKESRRIHQEDVFAAARALAFEADRSYEATNLSGLQAQKRLILLFADNVSLKLGAANKAAVDVLSKEYESGDVFEVSACDDMDGYNESAENRAVRIKEEFMGHGIPATAIMRAPCTRTSFRHASDDSPTPVSIVLYRPPEVPFE